MKNKFYRKNILISILSCLILFTACNNKTNDSVVDNKIKFEQNVQNIITAISNHKIDNLEFKYYSYMIYNNHIMDWLDFDYDISNYNIDNGIIIKNENDEVYVSLENNEFCAIKDFTENDFAMYNIDENKKCHKFYTTGSEIYLTIVPFYTQSEKPYVAGTLSDSYVSLLVQDNILDDKAVTYKWYRNNEAIDSANVSLYTITFEQEDADYYVEITTNDGQVFKSNPVNVKINRMQ